MTWYKTDPREAILATERETAYILITIGFHTAVAGIDRSRAVRVSTNKSAACFIRDIYPNEPWPDHWVWCYHPQIDTYGEYKWS